MSDITVFGAGAFGTALAISLAREDRAVSLVARSKAHADDMISGRENARRLPGFTFPDSLTPTDTVENPAPICLLAVPTQALAAYVSGIADHLVGKSLVACCKGVDLTSGKGPTTVLAESCTASDTAILSGPSFATDIAAGLPTALTIAADNDDTAKSLQTALSTSNLRLYRTTDVVGVELGGALKNVIAIAAGVAIGAGLGESARAALMTRGYSEMKRFAQASGASPDTLSGLSGFGDLVLTSTSEKSRNYAYGLAIGRGQSHDTDVTVEGIATSVAITELAARRKIDMPLSNVVAMLVSNKLTVDQAIEMLLARPLKKE